jgi:hypothetical protein
VECDLEAHVRVGAEGNIHGLLKPKPLHSKLRSITLVAIEVHAILRSFVVLTRMHDTIIELM